MKLLSSSRRARLCLVAILFTPILDARAGNGSWTVVGWNNLGMHCMDSDYSVFSILPPFNTIDAQLINASGKLVKSGSGIALTYEAVADPDGSINRTSAGKSSFWDHAPSLFGVTLPVDSGLAGTAMPGIGNVPQPMTFDPSLNWFGATGIPIAPKDDQGHPNSYPMMRITARNAANAVLARTDIVLPVSDEMDCRACHASAVASDAARPASGWVNDPNPERDYRLNILKLHDEKFLGQTNYQDALAAMSLNAQGLYPSVTQDGKSILCAACHGSEALGAGGFPGVAPLTRSMHAMHATVINPANGLPMDALANRSACYQCHPGSTTRCLRGAMGSAVAVDGSMKMQCQSCHGTMSQVGAASRTGWLDEPNCQSCHTGSATSNNGQIRFTSAFDSTGSPRQAINALFATNPDTPIAGKSLYRFSSGHGGLQCSACHGSTHAEYPSSHRNDNIQSLQLQGHAGVVADCIACHASQPSTVTGGPHGMHPAGQTWIASHKANGKSTNCLGCHGADYRGSVLSRMFADRTLTVTNDGSTHTVNLWRGQVLSCFVCHKREDNGGLGGVFTNNRPPVVTNIAMSLAVNVQASVTLVSSDPDGNPRTLRIVQQPQHGVAALNGSVATYFPEEDYAGPDSFTFAASDGFTESNLGTVSVTVGADSLFTDSDGDGIGSLMEYALGLSPNFPSTYAVPAGTIETTGGIRYLTLTINRLFTPPDVTLTPEVSGDLVTWISGAGNVTTVSTTAMQLKVRDNTPVGSASSRFIRLRVNRP